jgi:CO dehydrogenase/acetyl-CoA synthase delta subunit
MTPVESTPPAAAAPQSRWPLWLRRGPLELAACVLIGVGIFMMLQPFALALYTYSFLTTLAGVVMFTIVSKFPE